ncbi:hypothetical protein [Pandoraea sputorum]|uniref:hypothetical protein n=1 Tax=Pandoraea sputorum TaxID=93222 RepID=UPI0035589EF0
MNVVLSRVTLHLAGLTAAAILTGCAAMDPGNWQVFGPPSSYVRPAPVIVGPAPAIVQPAPVIVQPAPVVIVPAQPRSSRDAAHFLRERCYLEKGGCYTSEYREGYEFDPSTGTWGWVGQRDYRWKGSRGNR